MTLNSKTTTEKLYEVVNSAVLASGQALRDVGHALSLLDQRGADTSRFIGQYFTWAREVHAGRVAPEVALGYGTDQKIYAALKRLPVPEQQKVMQTRRLQVLRAGVPAAVPLHQCSTRELDLAITPEGALRPIDEQKRLHPETAPVTRERTKTLFASVSPREYGFIEHHAEMRGLTVTDLVLETLRAAGLLRSPLENSAKKGRRAA